MEGEQEREACSNQFPYASFSFTSVSLKDTPYSALLHLILLPAWWVFSLEERHKNGEKWFKIKIEMETQKDLSVKVGYGK